MAIEDRLDALDAGEARVLELLADWSAGPALDLRLDRAVLVTLLAAVDLALRHPGTDQLDAAADVLRRFGRSTLECVAQESPHLARALRRQFRALGGKEADDGR